MTKRLHGSALQRPKPKNFYEVGDVQVRVFDNAVALWMQMGNAWVKRTIQMRVLTKDGPMLDQFELINTQGVMTHANIERKHIAEDVLAKMDAVIDKARTLWILHSK
jgi:hypothetical protein